MHDMGLRCCEDDERFTSTETAQTVLVVARTLFPVSEAEKLCLATQPNNRAVWTRLWPTWRSVNFLWAVAG